ncbi:MAG: 30S ribosome-binding factor RbfA [Bacteroidetes bacterium]|jgi:ribosome-binding factor A|nr:MAG: 30S ribosome-binding factor RbfA [Bacteroidota bacterium]UCE69863.1 MAG: 30S ribosome-binding factor RbfA [Flavobacteriaceae bacterium]
METQRQKKIAGLLQQDLADILQRSAADGGLRGVILTVSKVYVTSDLSIARVYVSIFPPGEARPLLKGIQAESAGVRHELARRTRHQLRRVPELLFFLDDSLDYIEKIEKSLEDGENPIENPDLLDRRKKS